MEHLLIKKPKTGEYAPDYDIYISLVEGDDIISALKRQLRGTVATLEGIPEEKGGFRYAEGKWSVKELIGHVIDTERIMAYRALRIARNDLTPIKGFEQEPYIENANFNKVPFESLIDELSLVRKANVLMFSNLESEAWTRIGVASENHVSTRALAYIIAGHELHHINVLKEKYLA